QAPHSVAVVSPDGVLTYAELIRKSEAVAAALARRSVGAGDVVGVCMSRGEWTIPAVLGIWMRRAVYLPLDPEYPLERLAFMVNDVCPSVVIADEQAGLPIEEVRPLAL